MDRFDIQKLRDLPIEGVAERLGLHVARHKCLCPFHEDSHPSLTFKVSKNTCRCYVCMMQSMGPIDLVMRHLGKNFKEACRWLADEHNVIIDEWKPQPSSIIPQTYFDASRYERFFEHPWLNEEARRFLFEERRLDPRVVSWCRLTSWTDRQGIAWLQIPYYDRDGKLVGVQNRRLKNKKTLSVSPLKGEEPQPDKKEQFSDSQILDKENNPSDPCHPCSEESSSSHSGKSPFKGDLEGLLPRFRFPRGSQCGIYNLPVLNLLKPGDELYITEGCSDCWAMLSSGHKAIAIPSATLLTQKDIEQLSTINRQLSITKDSQLVTANSQLSITFHMYPDRDAPGERLFLQLQQVLPNLVHHQLPQGCKDYSEYFLERVKSNE